MTVISKLIDLDSTISLLELNTVYVLKKQVLAGKREVNFFKIIPVSEEWLHLQT